MSDKLDKLSKLLRQAETTTNADEAAAFMSAAQRLATTYSISLEVARQHQENKEKSETPVQKHITIGDSGKKGLKYYVNLFLAIARANDVKCNIAHNSTYVIAFGFPSDIEVTELLYASLVTQMIESSDTYIRSGEYKSEKVEVPYYTKEYDSWYGREVRVHAGYKEKSVDGRVARANFQSAFVTKISNRLTIAKAEAITDAKETDFIENKAESVESTGTALALKNKEVELASFYKAESTARGSWRGGGSSSGYSSAARSAGAAAGARARLSNNTAIGGSRTAIN